MLGKGQLKFGTKPESNLSPPPPPPSFLVFFLFLFICVYDSRYCVFYIKQIWSRSLYVFTLHNCCCFISPTGKQNVCIDYLWWQKTLRSFNTWRPYWEQIRTTVVCFFLLRNGTPLKKTKTKEISQHIPSRKRFSFSQSIVDAAARVVSPSISLSFKCLYFHQHLLLYIR